MHDSICDLMLETIFLNCMLPAILTAHEFNKLHVACNLPQLRCLSLPSLPATLRGGGARAAACEAL
jgi:hypothetical protein